VTEACQGPLAPAVLAGGRIDVAHAAVVAWATARGIEPASLLDSSRRASRPPPAPRTPTPRGTRSVPTTTTTEPADVTEILDLTVRELTDRHASEQGVTDWLARRKTAAEISRLESRNDRDAGRLVERERVRVNVFGLIEELFHRLLTDMPASAAPRVMSMVQSGATIEEIRAFIAQANGVVLRTAKHRASRAIRAVRAGDNPAEVHQTQIVDDTARKAITSLAVAIRVQLRAVAPRIAETAAKDTARAMTRATVATFDRSVFDEFMALAPAELATAVATMLDAAVTNITREKLQEYDDAPDSTEH
jgi:hypothetical protein